MLSEEKNRLLTEVGPDKPMGKLLRQYWHPIAGVSEFNKRSIKPIRILGEDLVLFKDLSGKYGLIARHCPHRNADLANGYVEKTGLRCSYHGWQFDGTGQCLHQPFEEIIDPEARTRKATKITGYKVQEKAGMLWAYLGDDPESLLPDWDFLNFKNGFVQVALAEIPCNWFQCQENSIDPVHFEWTHSNWLARIQDPYSKNAPTHLKIDFEEFDYGFIYKRIRGAETEDNVMWQVGRVALWPNAFYLGHHCEWRVPIDDYNTLSVFWIFTRVPNEQEPFVQEDIPTWTGPIQDDETGDFIVSHIANQDFAAWVGQGAITDRTKENLGHSDRGIVMMRRRFFKQMEALAEGRELKGVIKDPIINNNISLPSACKAEMINGLPREEMMNHELLGGFLRYFFNQAGQPLSVREKLEGAIGQKMQDTVAFAVHGGEKDN